MALVLASVFAGAAPAVAAVPRGGDSFAIERNGYLLGQAPDWLDERNVVFHDPFLRDDGSDGQIHIHRSTLDGKKRKCLTCGLEGSRPRLGSTQIGARIRPGAFHNRGYRA
jgi:hypothetical protein